MHIATYICFETDMVKKHLHTTAKNDLSLG